MSNRIGPAVMERMILEEGKAFSRAELRFAIRTTENMLEMAERYDSKDRPERIIELKRRLAVFNTSIKKPNVNTLLRKLSENQEMAKLLKNQGSIEAAYTYEKQAAVYEKELKRAGIL